MILCLSTGRLGNSEKDYVRSKPIHTSGRRRKKEARP